MRLDGVTLARRFMREQLRARVQLLEQWAVDFSACPAQSAVVPRAPRTRSRGGARPPRLSQLAPTRPHSPPQATTLTAHSKPLAGAAAESLAALGPAPSTAPGAMRGGNFHLRPTRMSPTEAMAVLSPWPSSTPFRPQERIPPRATGNGNRASAAKQRVPPHAGTTSGGGKSVAAPELEQPHVEPRVAADPLPPEVGAAVGTPTMLRDAVAAAHSCAEMAVRPRTASAAVQRPREAVITVSDHARLVHEAVAACARHMSGVFRERVRGLNAFHAAHTSRMVRAGTAAA